MDRLDGDEQAEHDPDEAQSPWSGDRVSPAAEGTCSARPYVGQPSVQFRGMPGPGARPVNRSESLSYTRTPPLQFFAPEAFTVTG